MKALTFLFCLTLIHSSFAADALETMSTGLSLPQALYSEYIDRVLPLEAVNESKCIVKFDYTLKPSAIGKGNTDVQITMTTVMLGKNRDHVLSTSLMKNAYISQFPKRWEAKRKELLSVYNKRTCSYALSTRPIERNALEKFSYLSDKLMTLLTEGTSFSKRTGSELKFDRSPASKN